MPIQNAIYYGGYNNPKIERPCEIVYYVKVGPILV